MVSAIEKKERPPHFAARSSIAEVEEGTVLAPKFDLEGLIPAVVTDAGSGEVLMLGYMNMDALLLSIETREAHYWSRSRQCLWRKGATSGLVQKIEEMRVDDDQDAVWLKVRIEGQASCHVGYRSCFYRSVRIGESYRTPTPLAFEEGSKVFDPALVYGDAPNPTQL